MKIIALCDIIKHNALYTIQVCTPYYYDYRTKNVCTDLMLLNSYSIILWFMDHILSIWRG